MVKKYLVLVLAIFLLAGNAYATRYDATGEWNVRMDYTVEVGGVTAESGTDYRTWDIVDNLLNDTFELEYISPSYSITVNGNYDGVHYEISSPFTFLLPDGRLQRLAYLQFELGSQTDLTGRSLFNLSIPTEGGWTEFANIRCSYEGHPVPEPATMILLGSGLLGLAGFGRKKIRK